MPKPTTTTTHKQKYLNSSETRATRNFCRTFTRGNQVVLTTAPRLDIILLNRNNPKNHAVHKTCYDEASSHTLLSSTHILHSNHCVLQKGVVERRSV